MKCPHVITENKKNGKNGADCYSKTAMLLQF